MERILLKPINPYYPCQPGYRSAQGTYHEAVIPPGTMLGRRVCQFFEVDNFPGGSLSVLPDGCHDIVLTFDGETLTGWLSPSIRETFTFQFPACRWVFGVRFLPGATYALFPRTPAPGEPLAISLRDLLPDFGPVADRLPHTRTFAQRQGLLTAYLPLASPDDADRVAAYCVERLLSSEIPPAVEELAEESGYSSRYIRALFADRIGHSPKELSSILRMQRALGYLWDNAVADLSDTAQRFGFSDQSHMNREFRKWFGLTSGMVKDAESWVYQIRTGKIRWF